MRSRKAREESPVFDQGAWGDLIAAEDETLEEWAEKQIDKYQFRFMREFDELSQAPVKFYAGEEYAQMIAGTASGAPRELETKEIAAP